MVWTVAVVPPAGLAATQRVRDVCSADVDGRCNQTTVSETTATSSAIHSTAVCVGLFFFFFLVVDLFILPGFWVNLVTVIIVSEGKKWLSVAVTALEQFVSFLVTIFSCFIWSTVMPVLLSLCRFWVVCDKMASYWISHGLQFVVLTTDTWRAKLYIMIIIKMMMMMLCCWYSAAGSNDSATNEPTASELCSSELHHVSASPQ